MSDHLQVLTVYFKTLLSVLLSLISEYLSRFSLLIAHTKGLSVHLGSPIRLYGQLYALLLAG